MKHKENMIMICHLFKIGLKDLKNQENFNSMKPKGKMAVVESLCSIDFTSSLFKKIRNLHKLSPNSNKAHLTPISTSI